MMLLSASLLFACGDGDEPIAEEDTSLAFMVIGGLARSAAYAVQTEHAGDGVDSASIDVEIACEGGGSVNISGTTATCTDKAALGEYDLTLVADGCTYDGKTISGLFGHTATAEGLGLVTYAITGEAKLGGELEGSCAVDVEYMFPEGGGYTISGSLCGRDTDSLELMTGLLPPWKCPSGL